MPLRSRAARATTLGVLLLAALALGLSAASFAAAQTPTPSPAAPPAPSSEPGVVLCAITPDGPAARAGVKRGSILLSLAGQTVNTPADLRRVLRERAPGDSVVLVLLHGDSQRTLTVGLADRDGVAFLGVSPCVAAGMGLLERAPLPFAVPAPGQPPRPFERGRGGPPFGPDRLEGEGRGAVVVDVVAGGPAASAGLARGEVIVAVDGTALDGPEALVRAIAARQPGSTVRLAVRARDGAEREVAVTLGTHPERAGAAYLGVRAAWLEWRRAENAPEGERGPRPGRGGPGGTRIIPPPAEPAPSSGVSTS